MAKVKPQPSKPAVPQYAPYRHEHPVPQHPHPPTQHDHPHVHEGVASHEHPPKSHTHVPHEHEAAPKHDHRDLRGQLRGAVRSLLTVIETGNLNSEQVAAIHAVRVIIGDRYGTACQHENTVYEEGDALVCQDCREVITPTPAG